jgi:hypothetical protein
VGTKQRNVRKCSVKAAAAEMRSPFVRLCYKKLAVR